MNMETSIRLESARTEPKYTESYLVRNIGNDEIYIGDLLRSLMREWKTIALIMLVGAVSALAFVWSSTKTYLVESKLRIPTEHELGGIYNHNIAPRDTLKKVVDQILSAEVQASVLENSGLGRELLEHSNLSAIELSKVVRANLSVDLVKRDYFELKKEEKTPFEEISVTFESTHPKLAAEFIKMLIEQAEVSALDNLSNDVSAVKQIKINNIRQQLDSLTLAAKLSREAAITRLREANQELVSTYQQEIDLKLEKALRDRENQIIRWTEAENMANSLGIREPVTWDDLRPLRKATQITNELGNKDASEPLYFRGTRFLNAELSRLKNRNDDRPFISGITELEKKIIQIKNDPKIAALKSRSNDTIYIEKFDSLQRQLTSLLNRSTRFESARMAVVSQPAIIPRSPMQNSMLLLIAGLFLSAFLALVVAMVRISLRNSKERQGRVATIGV